MFKLLLLSNDPTTLALLRAATDALKGTFDAFDDIAALPRKLARGGDGLPLAVVVDLRTLAIQGLRLANVCKRVRHTQPDARIGAIASATHWADELINHWARDSGASCAVAQIHPARWAVTGERLLQSLAGDREAVAAATRRMAPVLRAAATAQEGGEARLIAAAEADGIDLAALAFRMQRSGGVNIADRSYLLRVHPECFVASESIIWLERALKIDSQRAIALGRALQAAGLIYHVGREQRFDQGNHFFRVAQLPPRWSLERYYLQIRSEAGFALADRSQRGTIHRRSFIGSEAVDWMLVQNYTLNQALSAGQRLLDVSLAHHVLDDSPFRNDKSLYRFYRDEQRTDTV